MSPNQAGVYSSTIILCIAATIAVGLRLKARNIKKVKLGLDDAAILCALALDWAIAVILVVGTANGILGTHSIIDPQTHRLEERPQDADSSKYNYIFQIFIVLGDGVLKLSLLLLYRRLFVGRLFTRISVGLIILVILWTLCFLFGTIFWCGPNPIVFWTSSADVAKYCGDYKSLQLAHAVSDVITDLIILTVPIPIVWGLHLQRAQKIGLLFIFLLGFISTGAGIARMVLVLKYAYETATGGRDIRGIVTETSVWGYVEVTVGTITACLITFRPLAHARAAESLVNSSRPTFAAPTNNGFKPSRPGPYSEIESTVDTSNPSDIHLPRPQAAILAETKIQISDERI